MGEVDESANEGADTGAETRARADSDETTVLDGIPTAAAPGTDLAWSSIDDDHVEVDRASWRRVAAIGAIFVAAAAAVVAGIIAWGHHGHTPSAAAPTAAKPVQAPAEKPPAWQLNGAYRVEIRNPEGTTRNGATGAVESMSGLGVSTSTVWDAYETECTATNCTARTVALDDVTHQHADGGVALLRWNGVEWVSTGGDGRHGGRTRPVKCGSSSQGTNTVEAWGTISPLPDGSFRGTFHRTIVDVGCAGSLPGDQQDVPMVGVRLGDVPPGVFG